MATTVVSRKNTLSRQRAKRFHSDGLLMFTASHDCPFEALKGSLVPIGGYKGFGLSLAVDVLAGLVTGSAFAGRANPLNHPTEHSGCGHFLMVLNTSFFMDLEDYEARMSELWTNVKACGEKGAVFMPGEQSYLTKLASVENVDSLRNPSP